LIVANPQKESLGEYGSGWGWDNDYNTYAHVFDQISAEGAPFRYINNGAKLSTCKVVDITDGLILYSSSVMKNQISCLPNTSNAGNYYSFPASTAGSSGGGRYNSGDREWTKNSICSKGWIIPNNDYDPTEKNNKNYAYLFSFYNLQSSSVRILPFSFILAGTFGNRNANTNNGYIYGRGSQSIYTSSKIFDYHGFYFLTVNASGFNAIDYSNGSVQSYSYYAQKSLGVSLRCVAKNIKNLPILGRCRELFVSHAPNKITAFFHNGYPKYDQQNCKNQE